MASNTCRSCQYWFGKSARVTVRGLESRCSNVLSKYHNRKTWQESTCAWYSKEETEVKIE